MSLAEDTVCGYEANNGDIALVGDALDLLVEEGKAAALADNTRKAYRCGWASWARWAAKNGVTAFPAAPDHLQGWLATLWQEGKKPTTLRAYLAAVDYEHRYCAGSNPAQHPEVRRLVNGFNRRAAIDGYACKQAKPLRRSHIQQIIRYAETRLAQADLRPQQQQKILADIAMIALAHDALLRCSELLSLR